MQLQQIKYSIIGDDMQSVEIVLGSGESVMAEAGDLNYMDSAIAFETRMGDGSPVEEGMMARLADAGRRMVAGEALFLTQFTNSGLGTRCISFAAPYPGRVIAVNLSDFDGEILCQRDAFLCVTSDCLVEIAFTRRMEDGFFGNDGFILLRLSGIGTAFLHIGGTVVQKVLKHDVIRVDTGCIAAFTSGLNYSIERADNLKSMLSGGEGLLLASLSGTGTVLLQTMPFSRLAERALRHTAPAGGKRQIGGWRAMKDAFEKLLKGFKRSRAQGVKETAKTQETEGAKE
ncbi:MAG: TIGR00266 family protein [Thermodesulfobacteriota bacterium]